MKFPIWSTLKILILPVLLCFKPSLAISEEVYYCIMQTFVGAMADKRMNYQKTRFTMKLERDTSDSDYGTAIFSDGHPGLGDVRLRGFSYGWLHNLDGLPSFTFYPSDGQLYHAWSAPDQAAAYAAKCEKF